MIERRELRGFRVGGRLLVTKDSLLAFLRAREVLGTAEGEPLAEQIVRLATASNGGETRTTSTFAEYRSRSLAGEHSFDDSYGATWWKYVAELGDERRHLLTDTEHRTMSKSSATRRDAR